MRIRTVKPEFWKHPVLTKIDPMARLLAIGLLNYADDEGYFYADTDMIRGDILFREDSVNVQGWLTTLVKIGYIELRESQEFGLVGRVVKFNQHQVINRPTASRIAPVWDSMNAHGAISEGSLLKGKERNGREGNGKEGITAPLNELSNAVPSDLFLTYPCNGSPNMYYLTMAQVNEWSMLYQGLDVAAECKKALAWIQANNKKTAKGMPKFLVSWLGRSNDRGVKSSKPKNTRELSAMELAEQMMQSATIERVVG